MVLPDATDDSLWPLFPQWVTFTKSSVPAPQHQAAQLEPQPLYFTSSAVKWEQEWQSLLWRLSED